MAATTICGIRCCIAIRLGISSIQGKHDVAQKFRITTWPRSFARSTVWLPSVTLNCGARVLHPKRTQRNLISMSHLFSPIAFRAITLPNRIAVSPMCQYSSHDGFANDWHLVHLGSQAVGGAGLVFTEAAAVLPEGRITPNDLGIWKDEHIAPLARIVDFLHAQGAHAGIQLAHAGRKASMNRPWDGERLLPPAEDGWTNVAAPSAIAFNDHYAKTHELGAAGIAEIKRAFTAAARRSLTAGFDILELHAAHGYLLHEFLSPLSNHRTDTYGGSFENRIRLLVETVDAVRTDWPADLPLFVRISATDYTPNVS